ncbi:hypothetical protein JRO89_XS03G0317300 [Xanthoceras sorbifolium]|uniref:Protein kinase domain-containing protein n=1 Tax=Xanthoceras sorbifolium TaxID=99658 RepID=A0ABQ8ID66_9ROSI|nr:hypothetical protein JRO89_XS03G0317300 [Xanthoceras sorbifolium]
MMSWFFRGSKDRDAAKKDELMTKNGKILLETMMHSRQGSRYLDRIRYKTIGLFFRSRKYLEKAKKEEFMMENWKILLETLITASNGKYNPILNFSAEELMSATNNYSRLNVVKSDGFYELYKGNFLDQERTFSVMKFTDKNYMSSVYAHQCCCNNIAFASQMHQKNVLELIGCCLETQIPVLVFESVEHGTLLDRICSNGHQPSFEPLLWTQRLKIAMEIANAVAYLHVGFSRPIVFRDIKLANILFDDEYGAKLFDFSLCAFIPEGETHISYESICGTIGYLAPEYLSMGHYNEKCDVYSFDPSIIGTTIYPEKEQQLKAFAEIALKCISDPPQDRPTMVDVAKQLRQMYLSSITFNLLSGVDFHSSDLSSSGHPQVISMSLYLRTSKSAKETEEAAAAFVMRNGEVLLQKLNTYCNGKCNPIRYLQDRPVSVMKFAIKHETLDTDQCCFNKIVFISQMRHKNILKLIGFCLEAWIPVLVFERVEYGTLANRIS